MKKFFSNWIVRNVLLYVGVLIVLVSGAAIFLNAYTNHGKTFPVPDFSGMSITEAQSSASAAGMRVEIADSVYVPGMAKGTVYRQTPEAGILVKQNRNIMLVINAVSDKKVPVPNLVGHTVQEARVELSIRSLHLGDITYVPDIATDRVLEQTCHGDTIKPDTLVLRDTRIDVIAGLSGKDAYTIVPDVNLRSWREAEDMLHDRSLNVRARFDAGIRSLSDSLDAVVYRQSPLPPSGDDTYETCRKGTVVTIWLSPKK